MQRQVTEVKGVGPAKAKTLAEVRAITTVGDLLNNYPRRYIDRSLTKDEAPLEPGMVATILVTVSSSFLAHGRKSRFMVHCRTGSGQALTLVFFRNVGYFRRAFQNDQSYIVSGKVDYFQGLQMAHPDFEELDDEDNDLIHVGRIVPLYASTDALKKSGLDSRGFRRTITAALGLDDLEFPEFLPAQLLKKYKLCDRETALRNIHYPADESALKTARKRLIYEELFLFQQLMHHRRLKRQALKRELSPTPFGRAAAFKQLLKDLPFELTGEQDAAIKTILDQVSGGNAESFLLQGDVGAGKTVVALAIALHYADQGIQTAIMAPTEVLARQHYRTLSDLIGLSPTIQLELLTGADRKKRKTEAMDRMARGEATISIGTHSLLEDPVQFHNLGLIVIDEQHRFGVEQRETLIRKGKNPDVIIMTATPIPRTLSLTGFADLQLVTLKEKPAGRQPIKTMWLTEDRRAGMYKSVANHVSAGRQTYIVYPVIDESEKLDLRAATDAFEELSKTIFPQFKLALLHGRLKPDEKDRIMTDFREGHIQILVTTTVIEVGVDVRNATVMVIEHADRFGISQLHQLRGRVGRGTEESFCVLMSDSEVTEEARTRLTAVVESEDGFYLSEVDMQLRGPGELLGLRQHGLPGFRLADLVRDAKAAEAAHEDARLHADVHPEGQLIIQRLWQEEEQITFG